MARTRHPGVTTAQPGASELVPNGQNGVLTAWHALSGGGDADSAQNPYVPRAALLGPPPPRL